MKASLPLCCTDQIAWSGLEYEMAWKIRYGESFKYLPSFSKTTDIHLIWDVGAFTIRGWEGDDYETGPRSRYILASSSLAKWGPDFKEFVHI